MARFHARFLAVAVVAASFATLATGTPAAAADQPLTIARAQEQLNQAQARLNDLNNQVEQAQGRLDAANRTLDEDARAEAGLDHQLAGLARYQYSQPSLPVLLFRAGSIAEVLNELAQARLVSDRQKALLDKQKQARKRDQAARDQIARDLVTVQKAQDEAKQVAAQAQAALQSAQLEAMREQAAALAAQAQATYAAPAAAVVNTGGSVGNHFTYGYCTWYVANRRPIPWFGNAIEWWPNARAYGYAEGGAPAVGAVMVTRESYTGHVAYVEAVNPDGSWRVSEMNYVAWGVASSRTIRPGQVPVVGFIYGKA